MTVDFGNYTNRECGDCNFPTNYSSIVNAAACNATQQCTGGDIEFAGPTVSSCSPCTPTQFISGSSCEDATNCGSNEFEVNPLTPTTDRTCETITTTAGGGNTDRRTGGALVAVVVSVHLSMWGDVL